MKTLITVMTLAISADVLALSKVSVTKVANHSGPAFETTIEGEAAQKLYDLISGRTSRVQGKSEVWLNKNANGIVCGKVESKEKYACSLIIDRAGVNF